jgi:hypothetical protein
MTAALHAPQLLYRNILFYLASGIPEASKLE